MVGGGVGDRGGSRNLINGSLENDPFLHDFYWSRSPRDIFDWPEAGFLGNTRATSHREHENVNGRQATFGCQCSSRPSVFERRGTYSTARLGPERLRSSVPPLHDTGYCALPTYSHHGWLFFAALPIILTPIPPRSPYYRSIYASSASRSTSHIPLRLSTQLHLPRTP